MHVTFKYSRQGNIQIYSNISVTYATYRASEVAMHVQYSNTVGRVYNLPWAHDMSVEIITP